MSENLFGSYPKYVITSATLFSPFIDSNIGIFLNFAPENTPEEETLNLGTKIEVYTEFPSPQWFPATLLGTFEPEKARFFVEKIFGEYSTWEIAWNVHQRETDAYFKAKNHHLHRLALVEVDCSKPNTKLPIVQTADVRSCKVPHSTFEFTSHSAEILFTLLALLSLKLSP
jgi:hypothetical protein